MSNMEGVKDTAQHEAGHLAATTKDEVANVAAQAQEQARSVVHDAMRSVDEQSRSQRDRMVDLTRSLGDDLELMAQNGPSGLAADLARQVADKAKEFSDRLDGREPSELLDDLRGFARQRPGTFLLGALAAGVVVGRLARGSKDARSNDTSVRGPSSVTRTPAPSRGAVPREGDLPPIHGHSTGGTPAVASPGYEPPNSDPAVFPRTPGGATGPAGSEPSLTDPVTGIRP